MDQWAFILVEGHHRQGWQEQTLQVSWEVEDWDCSWCWWILLRSWWDEDYISSLPRWSWRWVPCNHGQSTMHKNLGAIDTTCRGSSGIKSRQNLVGNQCDHILGSTWHHQWRHERDHPTRKKCSPNNIKRNQQQRRSEKSEIREQRRMTYIGVPRSSNTIDFPGANL